MGRQRTIIIGFIALYTAGWGLALSRVSLEWAARGAMVRCANDAPKRPIAIVLGARAYADGSVSSILEDRLAAALDLYNHGRVRRILASGDHGTRGYDEVEAMRRWLEDRGVPPKDLYLDHAGFRTLDTMQRAAKVFGVQSAIVCTQRFHLPRALFLARRAGIDAVGLVADRRVYKGRRWNTVRESVASAAAVVDTYILHTKPRFLGPGIPITDDG